MHIPSLLEKKREGMALAKDEIEAFVTGFTDGTIPDYQMAALTMAVCLRGMDAVETMHLTRAMMQSGRVLAYPAGTPPKVDKHSTGGIGDTVSLVLAPLLACDELWVPMISGRGLGITGGTLDKLESIPGFCVLLSAEQMLAQLERLGVVMAGQTDDLCPADRKLYALRDVTGTVPSKPLIVSSIMSKKLAESLDRLVLDVKFGTGAFMKTRTDAEELAEALVSVGNRMGVETSAFLNPMDEPLGHNVGNALEVAEAVAMLQGGGSDDLLDITLALAERVSNQSRETLRRWLSDGTAWNKFIAMVEAQGGDASALERICEIHAAPLILPWPAPCDGVLQRMDAGGLGLAALLLGAGRHTAADSVDFAVGFSALKKTGTTVTKGEPLLFVHCRNEVTWNAAEPLIKAAITVG